TAIARGDAAREGVKLGERSLHRPVLERVELQRPKRGVESEEKVAPRSLICPVVSRCPISSSAPPRALRSRLTHVASPRRARATAVRTTGSVSLEAVLSASRADGCLILARPRAAHARISADSPL